MVHLQPRSDPVPALNAPVTEVATIVLKDVAGREELEKTLEGMATKLVAAASGVYGVAWGTLVEKEDTYIAVIGWESVEVSVMILMASFTYFHIIFRLQAHLKATETLASETGVFLATIGKLASIGATHISLKLQK